ncbi:MAG: efflux transporter outer membrane subunit [Candidatus Acidiferrales bacterium]
MKRRAAVAILLLLAAGGCTVGPKYKRPTVPLPTEYRAVISAGQAQSIADLPWVDLFKDPELSALIREAIDQNLDLQLALARVEEFRARARFARANLGPDTAGSFSVNPSPSGNAIDNSYSLGFVFNWEIDVFGKLRRASEASRAELLASEDGARAVMSSLVSDVAQTWLELKALDEERIIIQRTITSQEASLELVRKLSRAGVASGAEEQQALNQLATTRSQLPAIEQQIIQTENALSVLLGRHPGAITRTDRVPEFPSAPVIPAGLPAQLLERRPDIRFAENQLHAATARIGVARASRFPFPTIGLTSFLGSLSTELDDLFTGKDRGEGIISWGPAINWPLFDSGRGRASVGVARSQAEQAAVSYRSTILRALQETADALATIQKAREQITEHEIRVAAAREVLRLTHLRYRAGVVSYIEILDAQRQLFSAEVDLVRSRRAELVGIVQLYRALGGGWSDDELRRLIGKPTMTAK